jgi:hypothetical protein
MRHFLGFILLFLFNPLFAEKALMFKKDLTANTHWFPYGLVLVVLIVTLFILAKKSKKISNSDSKCKVIEKLAVHHKTKVYVIAYQGQQFLLADNQNSLAIHALQEGSQA